MLFLCAWKYWQGRKYLQGKHLFDMMPILIVPVLCAATISFLEVFFTGLYVGLSGDIKDISLDLVWFLYCSGIFFSFTLSEAILIAFYKIIFHMNELLRELQKDAENSLSSQGGCVEKFMEHNFDSPPGSRNSQRKDLMKNSKRNSINPDMNIEVSAGAIESSLLLLNQSSNLVEDNIQN